VNDSAPQMAPPNNAIVAVDDLVGRSGNDQERLAWAIVQGELGRLGTALDVAAKQIGQLEHEALMEHRRAQGPGLFRR
jgi:hypothetical protein